MKTVLELRAMNALRSLELMARNRLNETCERGNTRALKQKQKRTRIMRARTPLSIAEAALIQADDHAQGCLCPKCSELQLDAVMGIERKGSQFWDLK